MALGYFKHVTEPVGLVRHGDFVKPRVKRIQIVWQVSVVEETKPVWAYVSARVGMRETSVPSAVLSAPFAPQRMRSISDRYLSGSAECSDDSMCPSGFDCRRIDDGSQICVPGSKTCGDPWSDYCRTRVQVGGGDEATCSCDCIEGTTGACPDSMVCSNAYCTYRRGRIVCEPVDSQFQANEMPKCFPKTRSQVSCTT